MKLKNYSQQKLDIDKKIEVLGEAARWDIFEHEVKGMCPYRCWIYPASASGKVVPLFKVLMSNACQNNCLYCAHRSERDFPRHSFTPEELAISFIKLHSKGLIEGMFLSSAVDDAPDAVMEKMLKATEIVREKYGFQGYIHLKIMPGASSQYTWRAAELADRISINLEAPSTKMLSHISPRKEFWEIFSQLKEASHVVSEAKGKVNSATTQLMIGFEEQDQEILALCQKLYRSLGLARCYFSAFSPVPDTPLAAKPPAPKLRETRLYQADFLIRRYGFNAFELPFDKEGNLPSNLDPKLAWALSHPEIFPTEINRAGYEELLRVPGVGHRTANKILQMRREGKIKDFIDLKRTGIGVTRATPFILLDGKRERGLQLQFSFK